MNIAFITGRLTKDPESRQAKETTVTRFTVAANRPTEGTDFIPCVVFGKSAEAAARYLKKGMKVEITGSIRTGSYEKDGQKVYTTEIAVSRWEFGESKRNAEQAENEGFMRIPAGIEDEIPFN